MTIRYPHQLNRRLGGSALPRQPAPLPGAQRGPRRADVAQLATGHGPPPTRTRGVDVLIPAGGEAELAHELGRVPDGWLVVDLHSVAGARIDGAIRRVRWNAKTITLANDSSADITVRVEVH